LPRSSGLWILYAQPAATPDAHDATIVHACKVAVLALDHAPTIRLVITDLDNTLYDWVAWYARAVEAMIDGAAAIMGCASTPIYEQLRDAYSSRRSVEDSRALLELPLVLAHFGDRATAGLALEPALEAFTHLRADALQTHDGVRSGLQRLASLGIEVVGHTEASAANAVLRLRHLGLEQRLAALFTSPSQRGRPDERGAMPEAVTPAPPFVLRQLSPPLSKPNPATVAAICRHMNVQPSEVLYIGDNLDRDIAMARRAGVWAAWARYGTEHDPKDWARLVSITHWTKAEVAHAERATPTGEHPPHVILESGWAEIFESFAFEAATEADAESA